VRRVTRAHRDAGRVARHVVERTSDPRRFAANLSRSPAETWRDNWRAFRSDSELLQETSIGAALHNAIANSKLGEAANIRTTQESWTKEGIEHKIGAVGAFLGGGVYGLAAFKAGDIAKSHLEARALDELGEELERTKLAQAVGFSRAHESTGGPSGLESVPVPVIVGALVVAFLVLR
jgi:hypothetical protein